MSTTIDALLIIGAVPLVLIALAVGSLIAIGPRPWMSDWLERRRLAAKAREYGIDYIPGENIDTLRSRLIQERDARSRARTETARSK